MRDILPPTLLTILRDRYLAGVSDAEAAFDQHRADEDSLTGALGQSLVMREPLTFSDGADQYHVKIGYRKVRGRGPGAPEKTYGTDGFFQIEVTDSRGEVIRRKALPFQAKVDWRTQDRSLASQASRMQQHTGSGIVIDYSAWGYRACSAGLVVEARGNRRTLDQQNQMRSLGQVLANDFLNCTIGTRGLFFDSDTELFSLAEHDQHLITTYIDHVRR